MHNALTGTDKPRKRVPCPSGEDINPHPQVLVVLLKHKVSLTAQSESGALGACGTWWSAAAWARLGEVARKRSGDGETTAPEHKSATRGREGRKTRGGGGGHDRPRRPAPAERSRLLARVSVSELLLFFLEKPVAHRGVLRHPPVSDL